MNPTISRTANIAAVLIASFLSTNAQNLLRNGSLEAAKSTPPSGSVSIVRGGTDVENWLTGGAGFLYVGDLVTAADGVRSISLNFAQAGSIEQEFQSLADQDYLLQLDHSAYVSPDGSTAYPMSLRAEVLDGETVVATADFTYDGTGKSFPDVGWSTGELLFTGTGNALKVKVSSLQNSGAGPLVDNIRLLPGSEDGGGGWTLDGQLVPAAWFPTETQVGVMTRLDLDGTAVGAEPITYQWSWRSSAGATPQDLPGETGPMLSLDVPQTRGVYRVVASNALGSLTNETRIRFVNYPQIATQPEETRVSVGANLSIGPRSFVGSVPDSFQWYKDDLPLVDETGQYFTKTAELSDAGIYHVEVGNISGTTNSVSVPVLVFDGPVPAWIRDRSQPPAQATAQEGSSINISMSGEGAFPLTYLWYKEDELLSTSNSGFFSKSGAELTDSGEYFCVVSNATGMATSSTVNVIVYPPQLPPQPFSQFSQGNYAEGDDVTLSFDLTQGDLLSYQWSFRAEGDWASDPTPIPGATEASLILSNIQIEDAGTYFFSATNFVGSASGQFTVQVVGKPKFSQQPSSFEGRAGSWISMSASILNFSAGLTYQWHFNGDPIAGATLSSYSFSLSTATSGEYTVHVTNEAGTSVSDPAVVVARDLTPAMKDFRLVADHTIAAPGRSGEMLTVVGDGKLFGPVVTFQSVRDFNDVGGLYRWQNGTNEKIVDLNDLLPGMSATPTTLDGITIEENGATYFRGTSTNSTPSMEAIYRWDGSALEAITSDQDVMPGSDGRLFSRFGYPTLAGGKVAFLGFDSLAAVFEPGGLRGVYVWDGATLTRWVDSQAGLPDGNGEWYGNSSQVGFDGQRLAVWLVDRPATEGTSNGIFTSVDGSPLKKIAFTGDAIPGGRGTFGGFNSPPLVHDDKVLFLGHTEDFNTNYLMEYANGELRVIAGSGDTPAGALPIDRVAYGFDYLSSGDILLSANGPGQKQGIYRWSNGSLTEELTTLNTLSGTPIRFVSLYDADGEDCLITASFDGSRFGLYTTAPIDTTGQPPHVAVTRTATGMRVTWDGPGVLQTAADLFAEWQDRLEESGVEVEFSEGQLFFRVRRP